MCIGFGVIVSFKSILFIFCSNLMIFGLISLRYEVLIMYEHVEVKFLGSD